MPHVSRDFQGLVQSESFFPVTAALENQHAEERLTFGAEKNDSSSFIGELKVRFGGRRR